MLIQQAMARQMTDVDAYSPHETFQSTYSEGELATIRTHFESGEYLAERVAELGLDKFILSVSTSAQSGTKSAMKSAETAKKGFEVIKASSSSEAGPKHMSIVLATVKGDIHDIGKNIVRMLLENYGFDVIDLGKDVDPKLIVDMVKEKNIHLVGLSALMTTTVKSMEETIGLLRESGAECRIMVGGAVMSEVLAKKIGADYYAKDAAASAKIAAEVEKEFCK